jgi:uncharacterized Zn finger protein (UPF0148 family)
MTEPKIARRCPSCGVSIREVALFCPQCGVELPRNFERTNPLMAPTLEYTISETAQSVADQAAEPRQDSPRESPKDSTKDSRKEVAAKVPAVTTAKASAGQAALGAMGAKIHRATTLARDVEGDVIHRVQQVREISSVVLDEAGYDPSLRFVLVAAVLFILFLVIVLLNKLIS